jgi:hypothetical protein
VRPYPLLLIDDAMAQTRVALIQSDQQLREESPVASISFWPQV